ncbi:MAG: flagellar biosynthesis protein FliP [Sphingobium sp.]|uniref:flagellar type III secretion system pore protein FliP n=1 Tax=Sphingobium sp. TaxID=1912891 RepID=UPI00120C7FCD|nr:flagellar type III secretion system pore protein FliP [Sphingobium sp.]MBU0867428.1 flagellar type III secretion system pore protein FliP [Alphaproteobacteria bacterium]MBA4753415.1 flagellar type III secretion system pore protein FliP [Sphingobium sp.]MBU1794714.1 flagellar type III secretion system pore protein FliP [Alphaproteobacteria bacterium]MBU2015217.1 flagellar type III secretion system pore protein FliP [Alphaproteobacteria bacterium]TAJ73087.1 MAG: flagellar biosynthesis protein
MSVFADLLLLPDNRDPGEGRGPGRWRAAYATLGSGPRRNDGIRIALALTAAFLVILLFSTPAFAQAAPAAPVDNGGALSRAMGQISGDGRSLSLSLQILILMSLLTVLPSLILMMTSFTRIIIVLSLLRQALGLQQTPPNQVLLGLSLFLSLFVMRPAIDQINQLAFDPYGKGQISIEEAVGRSGKVLHGFMAKQTRESDLKLFAGLAEAPPFRTSADIPFTILLPAFVTSELKTAFQIGFMIFLPFLIIDLVVASTLMALGMMMLSPTIISMPFKLLLFVLVDGWALTMGSLAGSFAT